MTAARTDAAGVLHRPALAQRQASPHTIAAYRDTFRLLLGFAHPADRQEALRLDLADLDAR